jgi:hypothetical protein
MKTEGRRPLGKPRSKWEYNIEVRKGKVVPVLN